MKVIADPNWLSIVGLLFTFYGLGQIAGIATVRSAASGSEAISEECAARRGVRAAFSILLLAIGFGHLLLAQFVTIPFGAYPVLASLALAMMGLVFALVGDLWAACNATPSSVVGESVQSRVNARAPSTREDSAPEGRRRVDLVHAAR
jgi:hypothetical protein